MTDEPQVTEAMIAAARKAVRYDIPEVEARRIYLAMAAARPKGLKIVPAKPIVLEDPEGAYTAREP